MRIKIAPRAVKSFAAQPDAARGSHVWCRSLSRRLLEFTAREYEYGYGKLLIRSPVGVIRRDNSMD
jgi:hypothetical protein